jgi:DNA-binding response OmpR family regulator
LCDGGAGNINPRRGEYDAIGTFGQPSLFSKAMQILYVENDDGLAKSVQMLLHQAGHFCHTTGLGQQAVKLAERNDYDIIVLDIMLPDIDGYEVMGSLRAAGVGTPVLMQSSLLERDENPDSLGFEVHEFLAKPFRLEELTERMETVLRLSKEPRIPKRPRHAEPGERDQSQGDERREHTRFATLKAAEIIDSGRRMGCFVMNMSHGGAAIKLPTPKSDCPRRFVLTISEREQHDCLVRWRYWDKIGVKFL